MIDLAKLRTWDDPGETICADADAEIERLRSLLEDVVETLEAMDIYTNNPLYNRLVLAL